MSDTSVVVLSKYADIFKDCHESLERYEPGTRKVLVRDGQGIYPPEGWVTVDGPSGDFCYARNANIGINHCTGNVLLTNDDVRLTHAHTVDVLEWALEKRPDIGIISPRIYGVVGNEIQATVKPKQIIYSEERLAFVCVLIRREVIEDIGLLDERFIGYGGDDVDFCWRAQEAGWKLAVTGEAAVLHAHPHGASNSYLRRQETMQEMDDLAKEIFIDKWGKPGW